MKALLRWLLLMGAAWGCDRRPGLDTSWIEYPAARRQDVVDVYFGVEVKDPYRWLEEEASDEAQEWLRAQAAITDRFFAQLPERARVQAFFEEHWTLGSGSVPIRRGDRSYFWRPPEEQNHPILYLQREKDPDPRVVFDLNQHDPDGLRSTDGNISVSPRGRYVSYSIHYAGADAAEIRVYDSEAGAELAEVIPPGYTAVSDWLPDESGFFYTWVDVAAMSGRPTDKPPGVYRHRIGTQVDADTLVYDRPWQGMYMAAAVVADDEQHLLIQDQNIMGSRGGWGVRALGGDAGTPITWLIPPEPLHRFALIGSKGAELFLITDYQAPNWRIVAADWSRPGLEHLREVVPEQPEPISAFAGENLGHVVLHQDALYVTYIRHNSHAVTMFDLEGKQTREIELPFLGRVTEIQAKKGDPILYLGLESYLVPHAIYAYDTKTGTLTSREASARPEFSQYGVERVFYQSKDGTRIPMTIVGPSEPARPGNAKVLLYGYGGWGIPQMPRFDQRFYAWLELGGICAVPNLRGGNEYGEAWHQAGQFMSKQNVFDDFAAAAEYLVAEGYTTPSRIAILGGSNGGLLTAASYNQRPELFGAVISEVAAVDLLRLPSTPVGATLTMELGAPSTSKEMFEYLRGYSPLHNVKFEAPYPPILHLVGENDPRCKPGHIYKYVAEMQQTPARERLALLRVIRGAGHGSARRADNLAWFADELAFAWAMTE